MDLTQLSQMVAWLDEEHRRDREELSKLDQRLQSMQVENQEQARRIQDLEGRLASTQAQLTRFTQIEQALQQLKNEVTVLLDKQTEARLQAERDADRARLSDRETLSRSVAEVRKELPRFGRIEETLVGLRAEDQRLGEMLLALRQSVNNVSKDLDERTRTLPYIVEQRVQDNKRLAQVQAESVELLKRTDALATKPPLLEEKIQRVERDLQRILPIPDQIRREQQTFIEAQKVSDVDRQRQMVEWNESFAQQRDLIEKQMIRIREFGAQYEAAGRALQELEEFRSRVLRDQKQVAELQRLAEERQRKELADWQGENEQHWKKELLRWEYGIQEQQKTNQKLADRFPPLEKITQLLQREVEALWTLHEITGAQQAQEAQHLLEIVGKALDSRPKPEA